MKQKHKNSNHHIIFLLAILAIVSLALLLRNANFALLNPKGLIASQERDLIVFAVLLMLVIVLPVFFILGFIVWKFREGNKKSAYNPNWDPKKLKFLWWLAPTVIISILAVIMWQSTHALDPFKKIESNVKPITIQVVALQWKWLFIYPEQNIATVNFLQFPKNTPINFELTADAPMNSFWIPELGGQIYAMPGMSTETHLIASTIGDFPGSAAEINGAGFADMKFVARASTKTDFDNWVASVKKNPNTIDLARYNANLAPASENNSMGYYSSVEANLYHSIMAKFQPLGGHQH